MVNHGIKLPNFAITAIEYMKDHIFALRRKIRSDTHNLSSCEIEAWKEFRPEIHFAVIVYIYPWQKNDDVQSVSPTNWVRTQHSDPCKI